MLFCFYYLNLFLSENCIIYKNNTAEKRFTGTPSDDKEMKRHIHERRKNETDAGHRFGGTDWFRTHNRAS